VIISGDLLSSMSLLKWFYVLVLVLVLHT
jgi:hypothetical protein